MGVSLMPTTNAWTLAPNDIVSATWLEPRIFWPNVRAVG